MVALLKMVTRLGAHNSSSDSSLFHQVKLMPQELNRWILDGTHLHFVSDFTTKNGKHMCASLLVLHGLLQNCITLPPHITSPKRLQ